MGSAYIPNQNLTYQPLSTVYVAPPAPGSILLLEIDGVVYPNGYRIEYNAGFRNFFPVIGTTGQIDILCHTVAYGEDIPQYFLPSNLRVLVISTYSSKLLAPSNITAINLLDYEDQNIRISIGCDPVLNADKYNVYLKTFGPGIDPITLTNPVVWQPLAIGYIPLIVSGRHYVDIDYAFDWFTAPTTPQTIKIAGVDWEGVEGLPGFITFTLNVP
jgi:hypothetical protein